MRGVFRSAMTTGAAVSLAAVGGVASAATGPVLSWGPTTSPGSYSYGQLAAGQTASTMFTLTNSGGSATSALRITLTGSAAFSTTADTCTGTSLGPRKTCHVTVAYAPTTPGQADTGTLTAPGTKPSATASLALTGSAAKATPAITTTQQPASAVAGAPVADKATVTGGSSPTGTVAFSLYGNPTCAGTPLFTDTENLSSGRATSSSHTATAAGTDYWTASYSGDSKNSPVASGCADEPVTITKASPGITTTQQPASAVAGRPVADKATVTGGSSPTGTVTFNLYGNPNCTGTALFTDTETLASGTATSSNYTTAATGTVYWTATYNGDTNNNPATSGCADEPVTITPASPTITTTQQPATGSAPTVAFDQATVTGGFNPTGTVTFALYGNPNCSGTPVFTDANEPLTSGGVATGGGIRFSAPGTAWWVATYNGDTNNNPVTSGCSDEPVTITPAVTAITTTPQPVTATVGTAIADQATVTSGVTDLTGDITFTLYGNPNCTGTPLFTTDVLFSGNTPNPATFTSKSYTATAAGTDYWVASYSGDSNNNPVASGCADEPVTITAPLAITTAQQPATATAGTLIADQATVTGGSSPAGTVAFTLYDNPNCTGTPLFTDTENLSGGTATSQAYQFAQTGTDYWVASYSGDAKNNPIASGCADEPVTITKASATVTGGGRGGPVGTGLLASATVRGGGQILPQGTVTFTLYDNPNCAGTPLFTSPPIDVTRGLILVGYTPTAVGTDYWVVSYSGDRNHNPAASGCGDSPVTISPASPAITTAQQPATATVGAAIADQATATGGFNPTGTVAFTLYDNPNCTGTPLFTDTATLALGDTGPPTAFSRAYTATAAGTDYWVASYSGDSNNNPVASGCADEPVTITGP
jgi:hypothetical protein